MTTAAVLESLEGLDPFTTRATTVKASSLRECMVLMDPALGTPLAWLDHRVPAARNSGAIAFMAHDLVETGRFGQVNIHRNQIVSVLAR